MPMDDELRTLTRRVHDELGDDAYESAARRAAVVAKASTPRVFGSGKEPTVPFVDVGANEEYLVPEAVYLNALRSELRRLLQPH
jgi:hypothetical protein